MPSPTLEAQFDGLVGPTHNYAGLSAGNLASLTHEGRVSDPKSAAREGLAKMRCVMDLGVTQAVLPPQERPHLGTLRALGFRGRDEDVIAAAGRDGGLYLRLCSSASAMWAANAATVVPSVDAPDGRVHLTPANLTTMFHRAIEAPVTARILRSVFADERRFVVHDPLPAAAQLADEGAANHLRLETSRGVAHVFGWGRSGWARSDGPRIHPARQTLEASQAIARLSGLPERVTFFAQQHPDGIDAGAFHSDVLAVGHGRVLLLHDLAFSHADRLGGDLRRALGDELFVVRATNAELPVRRAVRAYPFNSQLLSLADGTMVLVAPEDSRADDLCRAFLDRVVESGGPVRSVVFVDVRQSMQNGGGPACLRLRVPLTSEQREALGGRVVLDPALYAALWAWVDRHYRDRLAPQDLADPALAREGMCALDELTQILHLGSLYDFQRV